MERGRVVFRERERFIMDILIDFDGTCTMHDFPRVGKTVPGAVETLKKLVAAGHRLILFTMRSNKDTVEVDMSQVEEDFVPIPGNYLDDAVNWFKRNRIPLYGVQSNPTQSTWTSSPKAYGQMMIDDSAVGCPLASMPGVKRKFVDWYAVQFILESKGLL